MIAHQYKVNASKIERAKEHAVEYFQTFPVICDGCNVFMIQLPRLIDLGSNQDQVLISHICKVRC